MEVMIGEQYSGGHDDLPVFTFGERVAVQHQFMSEDGWADTPGSNLSFNAIVVPVPERPSYLDDDRQPVINVLPDRPLPDGNPFAQRHPILIPIEPQWVELSDDRKVETRYRFTRLVIDNA
jgi:hypothetical protein